MSFVQWGKAGLFCLFMILPNPAHAEIHVNGKSATSPIQLTTNSKVEITYELAVDITVTNPDGKLDLTISGSESSGPDSVVVIQGAVEELNIVQISGRVRLDTDPLKVTFLTIHSMSGPSIMRSNTHGKLTVLKILKPAVVYYTAHDLSVGRDHDDPNDFGPEVTVAKPKNIPSKDHGLVEAKRECLLNYEPSGRCPRVPSNNKPE